MNIYLSTETNFENNGLGFLTDCISAYVDESLNGDYVLNITYPLNGKLSEYLVEDNVIKTNVGNDNYQLFRIARVNKDFNEIEVYALHISYDLLTNMLVDTYPQNLSCEAFGNWLFNHTQYESPFTFESDISTSKSARYVRRNPIEAIMGDIDNSMVNIFGGEVERDNFTFKLLQSRGQNNHVKLMIGKNITEIKTKVDITSMFTRIMPIGYDGLLLPEKFIDSPLINNYPSPRITKVEFSDIKYDPESEEEGVYTNIEDAYQALRNAAQALFALGIDKPQITINIDWLELSKTEQYKNQYQALETVRLGDTITAAILDFDYTTKVVKTTYNVLTDSIEKFEIGTIQKTIANTINQSQNEIQKIQPDSILDEARTNATNLINSALGGYIYLDYETGNLYIMDTDNPSTAQKVWRWNLNGLGYSSTGINGTYGIAMTMDGQIVADYITTGSLNTNVIQGYGALNLQVQTNTSDIATIKAEISDIADITTSASDTEAFIESSELQNIASSYPIRVEIHPIDDNISYLYPSTNTFPSDLLFPKIRDLKFTNTSTNEVFTYTLPQNLLYYDSENYDTFVADYETETLTITKKCGWNPNGDGSVILLAEPVITTYNYSQTIGQALQLTEGNYQVELPGYNKGYIMVRLMVLNAYTAQYALKVELNSAIEMEANRINEVVSEQVERLDGSIENVEASLELKVGKNENNQIVSMLNAAANDINITGNRIAIVSDDFELTKEGAITAKSGYIAGFTIDDNKGLYNGSGNGQAGIGINGKSHAFWAGGTDPGSAPFHVGHAGDVHASDIEIIGGAIKGSQFRGNSNDSVYLQIGYNSDGYLYTDNCMELLYSGSNDKLVGIYGKYWSSDSLRSVYFASKAQNFVFLDGKVYATQFVDNSLEEMKKDIVPLEDIGLDIVNNTDIYKFKYKNQESNKDTIGFIIGDKYNYSKEITNDTNEGANLYSMVSVCFKAIQEQQDQINKLQKEINQLKGGK